MDQINDFLAEQRRQTEDTYPSQPENYRRRDRDRRSRSPQRNYRDDRDDDLPSSTIKIKNLPSSITERDIRHYLDDKEIEYSSVRLVKDRRTGHTKGFGFVEFYSEDDARDWMSENEGEAHIRGYSVRLSFCSPRDIDDDNRSDYSSSRDAPWRHEEPKNTIMLRGIPSTFTERDIRTELDDQRIHYADVRLIRDKRSGQSRGFGFVEFETIQEAKDWMESQQGLFRVRQCDLCMLYSSPRVSSDGLGGRSLLGHGDRLTLANSMGLLGDKNIPFGDWNCSRCATHNFKRRDFCFKCNFPRMQNQTIVDTNDGTDYVGTTPCNTLILRNIDALTTEENITQALRVFSGAEVKQVRVMRDEMTHVSYCFAFVELVSVATACQIVDVLLKDQPLFEIDGKAITINYAKNTYNTILASLEQKSLELAARLAQPETSQFLQTTGVHAFPVMATAISVPQTLGYAGNATANAAAAVAQAALQQKQAQQQFAAAIVHSLHHGQLAGHHSATVGSQIAALSKQQVALQLAAHQADLSKQSQSQPTMPYDASTALQIKYPTPDTSTYAFEESSGFYYDPITGLYYDSNSHYFYDQKTTSYVYWDQQRSTYLPAPPAQSSEGTKSDEITGLDDGSVRTENEQVKKEKEKKEKAKTAKKIAKEMEKWAKAMNSQKQPIPLNITAPKEQHISMVHNEHSSKSADTGFAMLEAASSGVPQSALSAVASTFTGQPPVGGISGLVAQYGGDSDNEEAPSDDYGTANSLGSNPSMTRYSSESDVKIAEEESKLLDWNKLACLLCSRGFKDVETLKKHQNFSELHKKNVESLRSRLSSTPTSNSQFADDANNEDKIQYRDRAKERRDKYGVPSPPRSSKRARAAPSGRRDHSPPVTSTRPSHEEPIFEQPPPPSESEVNVGSRLMQKMGWQSGQGLGRTNQGRTEIVEAEFRQQGVGLGAPGAQSRGPPAETYKENVKRAMFARFHDME